jgi:hypothetical protein
VLRLSPQARLLLDRMVRSGMWGSDATKTAEQLLMRGLRGAVRTVRAIEGIGK